MATIRFYNSIQYGESLVCADLEGNVTIQIRRGRHSRKRLRRIIIQDFPHLKDVRFLRGRNKP
jgi:hypothetical protein